LNEDFYYTGFLFLFLTKSDLVVLILVTRATLSFRTCQLSTVGSVSSSIYCWLLLEPGIFSRR